MVFWLLIGSGLGTSFRPLSAPEGVNYLEYFFPGTMVMILLFTSIFSTVSIIEDRREGFLQSVLVAPIFQSSLVLGKILGGTTLALLQALLFLSLAPLLGIALSLTRVLALVGLLFLIAFGLTGFGFFIAWKMESVQGFHAIINLLLLPMWLLSGAVFPASGADRWVRWIMSLNPLTYSLAALRRLLYPMPQHYDVPSLAVSLLVTTGFAMLTFFLSSRVPRPTRSGVG